MFTFSLVKKKKIEASKKGEKSENVIILSISANSLQVFAFPLAHFWGLWGRGSWTSLLSRVELL